MVSATTRRALLMWLAQSWSARHPFLVAFPPPSPIARQQYRARSRLAAPTPPALLLAKPKQAGSAVDNYQTVSVNCAKCRLRLFRYKKKNGTKSNLVKCYVERISEDSAGVLAAAPTPSPSAATAAGGEAKADGTRRAKGKRAARPAPPAPEAVAGLGAAPLAPDHSWDCPQCGTQFARSAMIHGRPALKLVGGKVRMTKK